MMLPLQIRLVTVTEGENSQYVGYSLFCNPARRIQLEVLPLP